MSSANIGVIIERGPQDWQIVQQDDSGFGSIELGGSWVGEKDSKVQVRVVMEDTGMPSSPDLDWQDGQTFPDKIWHATIRRIPAGGLYRLETRLFTKSNNLQGEWSPRGDMRHFLGVGDVWVIAGQSNSAGFGKGPVYDPPELGIHVFRNSEGWALAAHPLNESTDTKHPVNREYANPGHSPYIQFARILKRELNYPIGLVPTALGGSPLSQWNPMEPGPSSLYENMLHCIELVNNKVRGILWYQGESDTGDDSVSQSYAERFCAAVRSWRKALSIHDLPVITVQLNRYLGSGDKVLDRRWSEIREAQRQVPQLIDGVAVVPTFDLPL